MLARFLALAIRTAPLYLWGLFFLYIGFDELRNVAHLEMPSLFIFTLLVYGNVYFRARKAIAYRGSHYLFGWGLVFFTIWLYTNILHFVNSGYLFKGETLIRNLDGLLLLEAPVLVYFFVIMLKTIIAKRKINPS